MGRKKGNPFQGKQIIGILAGSVERKDIKDLKDMDRMVKDEGYLKWFEGVDFGSDCNSASPALSRGGC